MILDGIEHRRHYGILSPGIERAFDYLADTDFSALEDGKYRIAGDEIFSIVVTYDTEPESARRFEAHRRYIDVQYILSGQEVIFWAPTEELLPAGEYSEENDTVFFEAEGRARLHLTPGTFALFYPEDAHKPNCARDEPERVRKVVVKVQVG